MALTVVWKIGTPSRKGCLHGFLDEGLPGTRAICSKGISADGMPLGGLKIVPKCPKCVERMGLMEKHGLTEMRDNFAGLIRARRCAEDRVIQEKTHWKLERHGGRRKDKWRRIGMVTAAQSDQAFKQMRGVLGDPRSRGGVRLVDPDGRVVRIKIRSGWMKEEEHGGQAEPGGNAAVRGVP